jgi:hypothetical protein
MRPKLLAAAILLLAAAAAVAVSRRGAPAGDPLALALLVADDAARDDALVTAWTDAAAEEGLPLTVVTASELLRPLGRPSWAGIVLPDSVHTAANDALVTALERYVGGGGSLMIVFDAATLTLPRRTYAAGSARLSRLAGAEYARYGELRAGTTRSSEVVGSPRTFERLGVAPGKYRRVGADEAVLSGYGYDAIHYSHYVTGPGYDGEVLLRSREGDVVLGERRHGAGRVLFVNLPLGYLKTRTDGLPLHATLRHFATAHARLPALGTVPDGRGGLVMNWHVDSSAALPPMRALRGSALFRQGPYSVHVTAGPDLHEHGDGLGLDVPVDAEAREWLRYFARRGDEVGSHGGWIHNYFGYRVNEGNEAEFTRYLELNADALEAATGRRIAEYSSPQGTHPEWITRWLVERGVRAYYFTGNTGMGPTKTYRDGKRSTLPAWAFPVLSLGRDASFEELAANRVPSEVVGEWLAGTVDFAARERVLRLVYFHPPGLLGFYPDAVERWLARSAARIADGTFRWYTMAEVAAFLGERERVEWGVRRDAAGERLLHATHPTTLARQSWTVPAGAGAPAVVEGKAELAHDGDRWIVRATGGTRLVVRIPTPSPPAASLPLAGR